MIVHGVERVVDSRCSGVCQIEELWSCGVVIKWLYQGNGYRGCKVIVFAVM